MPMYTMLVTPCLWYFSARSSIIVTWSTISAASRLRMRFSLPVAQKLQVRLHPIWLLMHAVRRVGVGINTPSTTCPSQVLKAHFTVPSSLQLFFHQGQRTEQRAFRELRTERLGQIAHIVERARLLLPQPFPELLGAVGFFADLGHEGFDLLEVSSRMSVVMWQRYRVRREESRQAQVRGVVTLMLCSSPFDQMDLRARPLHQRSLHP
jgi:hypothetical protein